MLFKTIMKALLKYLRQLLINQRVIMDSGLHRVQIIVTYLVAHSMTLTIEFQQILSILYRRALVIGYRKYLVIMHTLMQETGQQIVLVQVLANLCLISKQIDRLIINYELNLLARRYYILNHTHILKYYIKIKGLIFSYN